MSIAAELGDRYQQARGHEGLASAHLAAGAAATASEQRRLALELYESLGVPDAARLRPAGLAEPTLS